MSKKKKTQKSPNPPKTDVSRETPDAELVARLEKVRCDLGGRTILSDVDVELAAGEVLGVIGPNGGGKSTLLMLMAGLLKPTSGAVTVCDTPAHKLALAAAGRVGLVTARPGLYPLLTGRENLEHFGELYGLSVPDIKEKSREMLAAFDLEGAMEQRVGEWSTGMQQKLSLIRALLLSPALILFDEPTANLDPLAARLVYTELRKRADAGLACVLVTHDLNAAESVCDRVVLVDGGIKDAIALSAREAPPEGPLLSAWRARLGDINSR